MSAVPLDVAFRLVEAAKQSEGEGKLTLASRQLVQASAGFANAARTAKDKRSRELLNRQAAEFQRKASELQHRHMFQSRLLRQQQEKEAEALQRRLAVPAKQATQPPATAKDELSARVARLNPPKRVPEVDELQKRYDALLRSEEEKRGGGGGGGGGEKEEEEEKRAGAGPAPRDAADEAADALVDDARREQGEGKRGEAAGPVDDADVDRLLAEANSALELAGAVAPGATSADGPDDDASEVARIVAMAKDAARLGIDGEEAADGGDGAKEDSSDRDSDSSRSRASSDASDGSERGGK